MDIQSVPVTPFAGQRPGNENGFGLAIDHTIAAMTKAVDHQTLSHVRPR